MIERENRKKTMTMKIATFVYTFLSVVTLLGPTFLGVSSNAFSISSVALKASHITCRGVVSSSSFPSANTGNSLHRSFQKNRRSPSSSSTTNLSMYNLPPGGGGSGGGGGGKNEIADIAKGAVTILLTVGFFISPLGGLVLGIFNSFLVLLFVLPVVATVGFQLWQKINTVQGSCPNCGAPATVMKSKDDTSVIDNAPSAQVLCFNCGAILQANADNTGINNVSGRKTIDDLNAPGGGQPSIFEIFSDGAQTEPWSTTTTTTETTSSTSSKKKDGKGGIDKSAVIDVDILDEDKPFQ
jgi:hypothetical protein